jgi:outer membrane protein assembly factor BamB
MKILIALLLLPAPSQDGEALDWRTWRGPHGNGIAAQGPEFPTAWSESQNILWSAPVPGRGHSSPTVVGDRVVLTTADEASQVQCVVAFDRASGKQAWKADLHKGGFPPKIHVKNTHASCTVASDGERLFALFFNSEAVHVTALDLEGKKLWHANVGPLKPRQYQHGYGASPALYKSLLLVAADSDDAGGGFIAALDAKTGKMKWKATRPVKSSFSSPVVAKVAGRDQLLLTGCDLVASYDPNTGKPLWSTEATTSATAGTMVWSGDLVFGSGGWPKAGTFAVRADGSAKVVWQNPQKCYEQSMLAHEGHVYAIADSGVVFCWDATDGSEKWNARVSGKPSSSPVLAGGNLYIADERGTTTVFRADPKEYKEVARNRLGDEALATPAFCGGRIYARVAKTSGGKREEFLYCIGKDAR